jgi:hypothetical protein
MHPATNVTEDAKHLRLVEIAMGVRTVDRRAQVREQVLHGPAPARLELFLVRQKPVAILILRKRLEELALSVREAIEAHTRDSRCFGARIQPMSA